MARIGSRAFLAGLAAFLVGAGALAEIPVGPHLQDVRQDGVMVLWLQSAPGPAAVTVDGRRFESEGEGPLHEVRLDGLEAGARYDYTVEAGGETATGSFRAAPSNPLDPFRFVVMGDNRSNHDSHAEVVASIRAAGPFDFLVNTGDMVSSGDVEDDWRSFFDIERLLLGETPWYPVVGNHEDDDGALPFFYNEYLAPPTDTSGLEAYYSFVYGNSAFVVLDGHANATMQLLGLWRNFDRAQRDWLAEILDVYAADPTIQHIFVFNHEPPYSSKDGRDGSHALRLLLPLLVEHDVDAVITGHDHYLERGESPGGLPYFIMGGGGAPLYDNESEGSLGYKIPTAIPWLDDGHTVHFARSSYGYMIVEVDNGQVDVTIRDEAGEVLDTVGWNTGDVLPPPEPDGGPGIDAGSADAGSDGGSSAEAGLPAGDADGPSGSADAGPDTAPPPVDGGTRPTDDAPSELEGCSCRSASPRRGAVPTRRWLSLL